MSEHEPMQYEGMARDIFRDELELFADMLIVAPQNKWKLLEVIVHVYKQGLEDGFDITNFQGNSPGTIMEAYAGGYQQAIEDFKE